MTELGQEKPVLVCVLGVEQLCFGGHRLSLGSKGQDALVAMLTTGLEVAFPPWFSSLQAENGLWVFFFICTPLG